MLGGWGMGEWRTGTVLDLQREGILLVEDGNHGESRPRPNEFVSSGVAFIRAADLEDGQVLFASASRITDEARRRITKGIGAPGDVILSHKGTVGKVAMAPSDAPPFVCSPQTTFWRSLNSDELDRRYLYAFLRSPMFHRQLGSRAGETDMAPYVSLTSQRGMLVAVPPIEEQRRIAGVLGALDDKIEVNRRMNRTLEEMAQALFKSWFVDFDGHTDLVESELGPIPRGWRIATLGSACLVTMGQSPPGSTYNEVGDGMQFYQGSRDFGARFPMPRVYCTSPKRVAGAGDTLLSVRAPVGAINMASNDCCIGRGLAAIRHRSGSRSFTYYLARKLAPILSAFEGEGTVFGALNTESLSGISVIDPPEEMIESFELRVASMDCLVETSCRQMADLAALRDTLLPKLLSGEIRVPEAEKAVEAAT